jgi:hypothetical protein
MQFPPLTAGDFTILVVVGAIVLSITAELVSPYYNQTCLLINSRKLTNAALGVCAVFIVLFLLRFGNIGGF